jgi:hypothetical protein
MESEKWVREGRPPGCDRPVRLRRPVGRNSLLPVGCASLLLRWSADLFGSFRNDCFGRSGGRVWQLVRARWKAQVGSAVGGAEVISWSAALDKV